MTSSKAWLAGVVGFAAGVTVTWLVMTSVAGPDTPTERPAAHDVSAPQSVAEHPARAVNEDRVADTGPDAAPAPDTTVRLPDLPRAVRGVISGHVLTTDGRPLAGATIRAESFLYGDRARPAAALGAPPVPSEVESVERARLEHRRAATMRSQAVTDDAGSFQLKDLHDATFQVMGWCPGYELRLDGRRSWDARPGERFDFVATAVFPVDVDIRDEQGAQPTIASLRFVPSGGRGGGSGASWAPSSTTVFVPAGTWSLTASPFSGNGKSDLVEVTAGPGLRPSASLVLIVPCVIRGHVVLPAGEEWDRARMYCLRIEDDSEPSDAALLQAQASPAHGPTLGFEIDDLRPGRYAVGASLDGRTLGARTVVDVGPQPADCTLELPPSAPRSVLRARATSSDGAPLDDVTFQVQIVSGNGSSNAGADRARHQSDGTWLLLLSGTGPPSDNAVYSLIVTSKSRGTRAVEFEPGSKDVLDVVFDDPARLHLTVTGLPPGADDVRATAAPASPTRSPYPGFGFGQDPRDLDAQGTCTVENLAPGRYDLTVWSGSRPESTVFHRSRLTLRSGDNSVTVAAVALADVTVNVPDVAAGDTVWIASAAYPDRSFRVRRLTVGEDHSVSVSGVPVGDYVVTAVEGDARQECRITVRASGTFEFRGAVYDAMEVTIDDDTGPFAAAGLRTGDLIVAIDDTGFTSSAGWSTLLGGKRDKHRLDLTILRGRGESVIALDPALFSGVRYTGAHWSLAQR